MIDHSNDIPGGGKSEDEKADAAHYEICPDWTSELRLSGTTRTYMKRIKWRSFPIPTHWLIPKVYKKTLARREVRHTLRECQQTIERPFMYSRDNDDRTLVHNVCIFYNDVCAAGMVSTRKTGVFMLTSGLMLPHF